MWLFGKRPEFDRETIIAARKNLAESGWLSPSPHAIFDECCKITESRKVYKGDSRIPTGNAGRGRKV